MALGALDADLRACRDVLPDGIVLPKAQGPEDIEALAKKYDDHL